MSKGNELLEKITPLMGEIRGRMSADASMAKITWFQVGGPADILFQPADRADLALFLKQLPPEIPVMAVGIGSNLLVRDGGIDGVVIRLSARGFGQTELVDKNRIRAGAAVPDKRLAAFALQSNISGFEFYHGIPGAIGGALRMNAGANGDETTGLVEQVFAIDRQGNELVLSHEEMGYSYRHSGADKGLIFTGAIFRGKTGNYDDIQRGMDAVQHHRVTVQPIREKTGGSTFKNPEGHSSWKLIDEAGMRGAQIGGAQMSEMHCNFMINKGDASAQDLEALGENVRAKVLEHSGICLEWEIKRIGRVR